MNIINPDQTIEGMLTRFIFNEPGIADKYFELDTSSHQKCFCKGKVLPEKEVLIGSYLRLKGIWKVNPNPKYRHLGEQFYFTSYELIPGANSGNTTIRKEATRQGTKPTCSSSAAQNLVRFFRDIGQKKIDYEFHQPNRASIAFHVKKQLDERIVQSTSAKKDFFFLTALLDRSVRDQDIQHFRNNHPNFKKDLIKCWSEANHDLNVIIADIKAALEEQAYIVKVALKSTSFEKLLNTVPGRFNKNQLLACLKIIRDQYQCNENTTILDFLKTIGGERQMKNDLLGVYGLGNKLVNWALTNITGHWFVIDGPHIAPVIKGELSQTVPDGVNVSSENADSIFENWFGILDETQRDYTKFNHEGFTQIFPDFPSNTCEFLPFIVTQYLWFYGKYCRMVPAIQQYK